MSAKQEHLWLADPNQGEASFSADRRHRFLLRRRWSPDRTLLFVMLNPSIADERRLDPTVRKCMGFARQWGFGALLVGNLYSLISPYPEDLRKATDLVHLETDKTLVEMAREAEFVIAAWGTQPFLATRAHNVTKLLSRERDLYCLGRTNDGWPRHPLYRSYEADVELFYRRNDGTA
jgi:hypothetical protein